MVFNEQISLRIGKTKVYIASFNWPEQKEDDLNPTDNGEASEKSHGASNETQLGLRLDLLVSLDVVKGGRVKPNC